MNINPEYFSYLNFFEKHVSTPTSVQPFLHFDRFLDFVRYDNEAMYLKMSTDEDRANVYFDLNDAHFEPGSPNVIELKATRNIERYEQIIINPIANHDYAMLRQATPDTALYVKKNLS